MRWLCWQLLESHLAVHCQQQTFLVARRTDASVLKEGLGGAAQHLLQSSLSLLFSVPIVVEYEGCGGRIQ